MSAQPPNHTVPTESDNELEQPLIDPKAFRKLDRRVRAEVAASNAAHDAFLARSRELGDGMVIH